MINVLTTTIEIKRKILKMIIYNRFVIGLMMIVYITFKFYKNYNFVAQKDICEVSQILI